MGNLEDFKKFLSTLKTKIDNNRQIYKESEAAVRSGLIDPVLSFFEWDTGDLEQVVPEAKISGGRADYRLKSIDGQEEHDIHLEAKNLSRPPEDGLTGLTVYCTGSGVLYGVSSNGEEWVLFRAFEKGKSRLEDKILWKVNILTDPPEKVFANLSQISRKALPDLEKTLTKLEIERLIDRCLQKPSSKIVSGVFSAVREQPEFHKLSCTNSQLKAIVRGRLLSTFDSSKTTKPEKEEGERQPKTKPGGRKSPRRPKAIVLFDKTTPIRFSHEILTTVANELIQRRALSARNVPFPIGYARFLVNTTPHHPAGDPFRAQKKLENGFWVETHYSTNETIRRAKKLLEYCGCKASDLRIMR